MNLLNVIYQVIAESGGVWNISASYLTDTTTAADVDSNNITLQLLGETYEGIWPTNPIATHNYCGGIDVVSTVLQGVFQGGAGTGRIYKVGDVDFTSESPFAHVAATFPLLRNVMGVSDVPVAYIPIILVTETISGAQPEITFQAIDNEGYSILTPEITKLPVDTVAGSAFVLKQRDSGTALQDITDIFLTTTSTTGAGIVFLLELLSLGVSTLSGACVQDPIVGSGLRVIPLGAAKATSGDVEQAIVGLNFSNLPSVTGLVLIGVS